MELEIKPKHLSATQKQNFHAPFLFYFIIFLSSTAVHKHLKLPLWDTVMFSFVKPGLWDLRAAPERSIKEH